MNIDFEIAAKTIWAESRNQTFAGQLAVAYVILNRVGSKWKTIKEVCWAPKQFSCWNNDDPQLKLLAKVTPDDLIKQYAALFVAISKSVIDPTNGANHYHTKMVNPYWADTNKITATIGDHIFYRL